MNKNVISLFTFGLVLILIGGIGSFFNWNQAMIFIGTGLTMESLALIIFAWKRLKK
jgi:Kef-type K+ transport system membrane component KefB